MWTRYCRNCHYYNTNNSIIIIIALSLFLSSHNKYSLHDGCWSPTRPAVYYTVSAGGILDVWDIGFKHNTPTLSIQVHTHPINTDTHS